MNIIALLGSPHGLKGNTGRLLSVVLEGAGAKGAQTETIVLNGKNVQPCNGCDACHRTGRCNKKDDFEIIRGKILKADALVLASPNYIDHVSAQLKAFMDRCSGVVHCMAFEGRYGASVVTSGGGDEQPIAKAMDHFLLRTGVGPVGSVWATMGNITGTTFPADIAKKAFALGGKIVRAVDTGMVSVKVEREQAAFRERMKTLISWRGEEWPYEYAYWKEKERQKE